MKFAGDRDDITAIIRYAQGLEGKIEVLRGALEEICRCTDMRAGNGDARIFGIADRAKRNTD